MTSETTSVAGHTYGMESSDGQTDSDLVRTQRVTMAIAPYSIGQPTSAALDSGSVNIRAGYMDCRAARSPLKPYVNTASRYTNETVIGTTSASAKLSSLSKATGTLRTTITSLIVARTAR